jgi:predicted kinase
MIAVPVWPASPPFPPNVLAGMMVVTPLVHMLCGLPGSGKTVYAKGLEAEGCVRLSVDELVEARHGRHDIDYPAHDYPRLYDRAVEELDGQLVELLREGRSVVLDYGLWERSNRDRYKRLIEEHGGRWRLVYFKAEPELLRSRLLERNRRSDPNALTVTDAMLADFLARFEAPSGEGEVVAPQAQVVAARALRPS